MVKRNVRDQQYLIAIEDINQSLRENQVVSDMVLDFHPQKTRYAQLENMVASERRLLEEVSLPCRLVLEHFSAFLDQPDRYISVRYGLSQYNNGSYQGFSINEWGHVSLKLGDYKITWRDDEYQYMFYSDKIILRAYDIQKPEVSLSFNFPLKYSKILEEFEDVTTHRQTAYYQPDLFEHDA